MAIKQQPDVLTGNSVIVNQDQWVDNVYEIAEQDYVHGGPQGYSNVPHEQLANRTYHLKTIHEQLVNIVNAFKAAVASQDTINAQDFATIRQAVLALQSDLLVAQNDITSGDAKLQAEVDVLVADVNKLANDLATHVHKYAGSDVPGGDALTVRINSTLNKMYVTGVVDGGPSNEVSQNSKVTIINDAVLATNFTGDLVGNATSASRLFKPFTISLTGDVSGLTKVDGGSDVSIQTTIAHTTVAAGSYGPVADEVLDNFDRFIVPSFTVNASGMITGAVDRTLMLPSMTRSKTSGATDTTGKLFIVGAQQQTTVEQTYTEANAYVSDGTLFSNNIEVVNLSEPQDLTHKTYNGFTLKKACTHGVDTVVGGLLGSQNLITSDAVARHVHNYLYAGSLVAGGPATDVEVDPVVADRNIVVNDGSSTKLEVNKTVTIGDGSLTTNNVTAVNKLTIPGGGELWYDSAVNGVSVNPGNLVNSNSYDDTALRSDLSDLGDKISVVDQRLTTAVANMVTDHQRVNDVYDQIAEVKGNVAIVNAAYTKLSSVINSDHAAVISSVDDVLKLKSTVTTLSNTAAVTSNDIVRLDAELQTINANLATANTDIQALKVGGREVTLAKNVTCSAGELLSYAPGGYVLADNSTTATVNLVLTLEPSSQYGYVMVSDGGGYVLPSAANDGCQAYVGLNGGVLYAKPQTGKVVGVGFVEGSTLIFRPSAS